MLRNINKRLQRLESAYGDEEELPTLFITVTDASVPEPGQEPSGVVYGDETTVGYYRNRAKDETLILREPGETIDGLQRRVKQLHPEQRLFWATYVHELGQEVPQ